MNILFHKKFRKFIEKIKDKTLLIKIKSEVDFIIIDPNKDKLLEHPFKKYKIRSISFLYKKNSYRIAYTLDIKSDNLIFLLVDSRENFYEKLVRQTF